MTLADPIQSFPTEIFKAYDIRGIFGKTLTTEIVRGIGQAIGSEARARRLTSEVNAMLHDFIAAARREPP